MGMGLYYPSEAFREVKRYIHTYAHTHANIQLATRHKFYKLQTIWQLCGKHSCHRSPTFHLDVIHTWQAHHLECNNSNLLSWMWTAVCARILHGAIWCQTPSWQPPGSCHPMNHGSPCSTHIHTAQPHCKPTKKLQNINTYQQNTHAT